MQRNSTCSILNLCYLLVKLISSQFPSFIITSDIFFCLVQTLLRHAECKLAYKCLRGLVYFSGLLSSIFNSLLVQDKKKRSSFFLSQPKTLSCFLVVQHTKKCLTFFFTYFEYRIALSVSIVELTSLMRLGQVD